MDDIALQYLKLLNANPTSIAQYPYDVVVYLVECGIAHAPVLQIGTGEELRPASLTPAGQIALMLIQTVQQQEEYLKKFLHYIQPRWQPQIDGGDAYCYCTECRAHGWSESDLQHSEDCLYRKLKELLNALNSKS